MTPTTDTPATTFALVGDREIVMTRWFAAPRELVWQASTTPAHMERWWGPRGFTTQVLEMDVRPGGRWRIEQRAPDGTPHAFRGEYLEVQPPTRLVHTQQYLEYPPLVVTFTLNERDGGTLLTSVTRFDVPESREATLRAGMEWGARQSIDRLAELLETL